MDQRERSRALKYFKTTVTNRHLDEIIQPGITVHLMGCLHQGEIKRCSLTWYTALYLCPPLAKMGSYWRTFSCHSDTRHCNKQFKIHCSCQLDSKLWNQVTFSSLSRRKILTMEKIKSGGWCKPGKQLTLSQPGGQIMPTTVLRAPLPQIFRPCDGQVWCRNSGWNYYTILLES